MMITIVPFLAALIGVLMFALCANPKLVKIGEILFFCGVLICLYVAAGHQIKIG